MKCASAHFNTRKSEVDLTFYRRCTCDKFCLTCLDLFGKEGRTKIYPKNEDAASETTVLDRRALKDELSEEERAAEEIPVAEEEQAPEEAAEVVPEQEEKKRKSDPLGNGPL